MKRSAKVLSLLTLFSLLLVACENAQAPVAVSGGSSLSGPASLAEYTMQRSDAGQVTVDVTPLNLGGKGQETLQFKVAMNTHSVDLGFDLAQLAILRTDVGDEVAGLDWDAPRGGHHVNGTLSFPAVNLEGVQWIALILSDVAGVPERVLRWNLALAP